MKAIINGKIITKNDVLYEKVLLFNEKIIDIINKSEFEILKKSENVEIIDAKDLYVSPGFIDVHIHGSGGYDAMDGTVEALETISKVITQNGVTGFLPTTMTMSKEKIYSALDVMKQCMNLQLHGAKVLGAHVEGPFINKKYKGAQKEDYIKKPEYSFIEPYKNVVKIITLAPEEDENFDFISKVKQNTNIVMSIGHSDASYEQAVDSVEKGISHATHLFNAMTPLRHREPGIVGAAFNSDIYCELIADTIHVHPAVFNIILKEKGKEKIILITDSMRAGCLRDGVSELGGQKVIVKNNSARLEDGTLAGSILTLNRAVKNFMENTDLKIYEAVNMASLNPAKSIGIDKERGSIEKGKYADITLFDNDFNVKNTIVEGRNVFKA
ncbi:N-acetylglucosamine-6-phosphate deacetylase [Haloimpatiens sp. FM7330]|uniref:N-acetylglucosamine-6-phosphate deacetylase n=1 Tax=Haloimpatiens sp. FM7330 TaxID=3298610 RepID=UPI00363482A3